MSGRKYSDDFKENVLETYRNVGLNEAARRTGVDKHTLLRWARDSGLDSDDVRIAVSERNARATSAANARIAKDRAEARERILNRLIKTSEAAAIRELEILTSRSVGEFGRDDLQAVTNARMKAVQQFELLEGRATSRPEHAVEFEQLILGVAAAFRAAVELVPEVARAAVEEAFAIGLRNVRELDTLALTSGDIEDGEFENAEASDEADVA